MDPVSQTGYSSGAPPVVNNDGNLIKKGRIRDTAAAISLHALMWNADRPRARDRSQIQSLLDNFPVVDPAKMQLAGKGNCSNFNPGDAERVFLEECSPYIGLAYSGRTLFTTPTKEGSTTEQARWSQIIAEEMTDTIRGWEGFLSRWQTNVIYMKRDGMSFCMHDDPYNWQWKVHSLEYAKIPNHTELGVNNLEYISMEVPVQPYVLYEKIKDPEIAREMGWNIEAARKALMDAAPDVPISQDYERWEEYWKNNDYLMGDNTALVTKLIYLWCREVDGSVSQYITRMGDEDKEFIFKKECRFISMGQFLHPFIENLGSNGTYHSIRGVGHKIYSKAVELARLVNKFADLVDFDSTPILQPAQDVDTDDMQTVQFGYFNVFPTSFTFPTRQIPNYNQTLIPALDYFRGLLNSATSKKAQSAITEDSNVSRYVLEAVMQDDAQVTGQAEFLFYTAAENLFREVARRLCAEDYDPILPGGTQAADFRRRVFDRGVPLSAIYNLDFTRIRMNRVIGGGNNNVRALKLQSLEPMAAQLDPVGRNRYQHDLWAALLDEQAADYYCPIQDVARLPDDAGIAQCENNDLIQGLAVHPIPGQNDEVHCMIHLQKMGEFADQVVGQSLNLVEVTPPMRMIADHVQEHIPNLPENSPSTKAIVESLQQFMGMIENGELQILRMQEAQANEEAQNGGGEQVDPQAAAEERKIEAENYKAAIKAQEQLATLQHKTKMMQLNEEERRQKLAAQKATTDLQTALKMRSMAQPKKK